MKLGVRNSDVFRISGASDFGLPLWLILLLATFRSDATTVGGLVTEALGHLPSPGERVTIGEHEFEVERVVDRAVESIVARRLVPATTEERD